MTRYLQDIEKKLHLPSPLQALRMDHAEVGIKRDDLIHPEISGNKWRKLRGHLEVMEKEGFDTIITAGGAFSNHLAAVAALGKIVGFSTIGLVAYHQIDDDNPVLAGCKANGMQLIPIGREEPKQYLKTADDLAYGYFVPQGGADERGALGMKTMVEELRGWVPGTVVVGVGYGAMIKGLDRYLPSTSAIIGVTNFDARRSRRDVEQRLGKLSDRVTFDDRFKSWGFGRYVPEMVQVATRFYDRYGIILDPIYTVKVAAFLEAELERLKEPILMVHSGGVQGWKGFHYRYESRILPAFVKDLV
jgi:1-aminocyclopropane-1-carboxylate deaminase/D-cysteine desulfhydrase-like pyridoxal-dependent ACC family enzyme